jgi:hypothetical protein
VDPRTHDFTESGLFPNFFLASKEKGCIQASPWCLQHFYPTWLLRMDLKAPTMIIIVPLTMLAQKNMKWKCFLTKMSQDLPHHGGQKHDVRHSSTQNSSNNFLSSVKMMI